MRLNIYIQDGPVLDYLNRQDNKSKYISRLILDDMKGGPVTRDEVIKLIESYTKPNEYDLKGTIQNMFEA